MMNINILETQISVSQIGNRGTLEKGVTTVAPSQFMADRLR